MPGPLQDRIFCEGFITWFWVFSMGVYDFDFTRFGTFFLDRIIYLYTET